MDLKVDWKTTHTDLLVCGVCVKRGGEINKAN